MNRESSYRMSAFYRRFYHSPSTVDSLSTSSLSTTSSSSSFEQIFSRLLDALIFTSAIAITAYSYLTGNLLTNTHSPNHSPPLIPLSAQDQSSVLHHHYHKHHRKSFSEQTEEDKRQRTQAWAEQHSLLPVKKRTCSNQLPHSRDQHLKREKKRTQSLPVNKIPKEEEDEVLLRMEERLKSMIQEGQEALSSPVKY
ncbi:hypothetical protein A0J61_01785 [Choanephora cucurbitarum]|uniref:Uncharacterized protein n=1 Tax=Choanephora cucurbitarum TaxID=101091 RepID=A0A1C7NNX8_9FUNG|nr:hypothetical protein A0J61_01785 [Choanephora cucurbitarum]